MDRADSRNTTDAEVLDELRWLPTDLLLLKERLSPLAKLYKGGSKQWQALRRVAYRSNEITSGRLEMGA